jgi:hypothetical protein
MSDTTDTPIMLSSATADLVRSHCARTGLTRAAAIEDLLRRGAAQFDLRELRATVEDIRATALDTFEALDALGPYAIAALSLMAHWATHTGTSKLNEIEYAEAARDAGRATWDGHLVTRAIPLPLRPAAEQPSDAAVQA